MITANQQTQVLDVVIIGGGLVGGLTALLLAQGGVQATVLDAAPILDAEKTLAVANPRVLALSQATIHLLKTVNVWSKLARHMPYSGMQVWNKNGYGEINFGASNERTPAIEQALGSMVEPSILNLAIQQQMLQQVQDYRTQVKVTRLERGVGVWHIYLADGTQLQTKLVIGADGANSFVREQAFIDFDVLDYRQAGLTCAIRTAQPHQHVARQIFLETGPLAYLPMASLHAEQEGHWQSIVWTLPDDYAEEYAKLNDDDFTQLLTRESHHMLGEVLEATPRAIFPLKARAAQRYVQDGLALIGDAAHVIHPLAGQGVNIGCLDAAVLCDVLLHDFKRGVWAHEQTLKRYEHRRKGQNDAMMHSMSAIGWMETTTLFPVVWARNFGLKQVEQLPALKDAFMSQASGLSLLKDTRYAV
ncbi:MULTISPECIES: FAD-dependent monooxygenase [Acinetobacter]|jgi:ubiquinone biosynthesis UbiH/UbiF/VisC/COQ6 family hydroxylase|uniref:FAD-dependent monooxygenase n=1 Tax=Acinetobacter towneri TaxID=202956 RepID=A0AAP4HFM6_9GAMM|nr:MULTISPECIES: FAD-dependent monooxygenase [Acinetobacter]GIT83265.1 2-octaprenyl-3-methyl-6-methoxy-1,4-benzoquinol hydroxylase [Acinetobacter seohaensis]MCA4789662.1 FAD-dependent monooxygenase [Acinetobacter towneri]MCA4797608.1 FAD-dependent monooxygenase [Acinetobacter towneri]MCO8054966.1 FAD-dependent monooxygenase [Acinetobacter towneri]MDM1719706.1 FAD-dependent monooxygenase [Acinetobacter towneri]